MRSLTMPGHRLAFAFLLAVGVTPALGATACSSSTDDAVVGDESEITSGDIVAGDSPYYWANLSYEDYDRARVRMENSLPAEHILSDDDPIRVRLQAWADRFDEALRKRTGNRSAPKPVIKLLQSALTYNAWSIGTLALLGAPFGPPLSAGQSPTMAVIGVFDPRMAVQDVSQFEGALVHPAEWTRLQSFTQVWNLNQGICKLSSAGGRITTGATCAPESPTAGDVAVLATTPFVTLSTDLVSLLDEEAAVFVMAHELGHMYRSHSSPLVVRKYDFWYDSDVDGSKRPVPSADSEALKATLVRISRTQAGLDAVEGARLQVRGRLPLVTLGKAGAFDDCPAFVNWKSSNDWFLLKGSYSYAPGDPTVASTYLSYEATVLSCPNDATFRSGAPPFTDGKPHASLDEVVSNWNAPLDAFYALAVPREDESVADYLKRLEELAATLGREEEEFRQTLDSGRMGFYTIEQEADEVAVELLARVGVSPDRAVHGWLQFMKAMESIRGVPSESSESGEASAEQCEQWLAQDFTEKDASGVVHPVHVTLGSLSDSHHGGCYRLYNLWREVKSHRFHYVKDATPPTFDTPWSELQAHAAELTKHAEEYGF